jgi:hypothetical protein
MGQEVECTAYLDGRTSIGKAYLGSDHVLFRGEFRVHIPFKDLTEVRSMDGHLHLMTHAISLSLKLGRKADQWMAAIRNPKTLLEKLEVTAEGRAAVIDVSDRDFLAQLAASPAETDRQIADGPYKWIFFGVEKPADLERLRDLSESLVPGGMIWVIMRKGKEATVKDSDLFPAATAARMAVVKVAAFSETHTAQKLVVRKAQ